ncbi:MAG: hypothetical protein GY853_12810 [PVC group bacterium]|nr:hypothetical protein [PVC group bacterium]
MKCKLFYFIAVLLGIILIPVVSQAEPTIIKDINIDTDGQVVKISIISNQSFQVESFKNEEDTASYIVVDFLGTVYTDLPSVIKVDTETVGKINLVRGDAGQITVAGKDYRTLDFLAIMLEIAADYNIVQEETISKLNVAPVGSLTKQKAVALEPPIVVAKVKKTNIQPKKEIIKKKEFYESPRKKIRKKKVSRKKTKKKKTIKKAKSSRKAKRTRVTDDDLINRIVEETVKEKEAANAQIEELTTQLHKMQDELNISKTEQAELENRINAIISKLDNLNDALTEGIRKRRELGEQVDDLVSKRKIYLEAKKRFESLQEQFAEINDKVEVLNEDIGVVKTDLDDALVEEKKLEKEFDAADKGYEDIKTEYDDKFKQKKTVADKVSVLNEQIAKLKKQLGDASAKKDRLSNQLKNLESKRRYNEIERMRIKEKLVDKKAQTADLSQKHMLFKQDLSAAVIEQDKTDNLYRDAEFDYEKIRSELESFLEN